MNAIAANTSYSIFERAISGYLGDSSLQQVVSTYNIMEIPLK